MKVQAHFGTKDLIDGRESDQRDWNASLIAGSRCRREYSRHFDETNYHHDRRVAASVGAFFAVLFALYAVVMALLNAKLNGLL